VSHPLYELLQELDKANVYYTISRHRDDTVLVSITFVGERVEVDVFDDGHMEVSRFLGTEDILGGKEVIYQLIQRSLIENKLYDEKYKTK
jgi:hypothetical protein